MVTIRKADTDDIKLVRIILAAVADDLTARFGCGHWSTVRSSGTLRKYIGNGALHVVEVGAVAVGSLKLTPRKIGFYQKSWFAVPQDAAAYLSDMAIDPAYQRRGLGRQSMEALERLAQHAGLKALRLDAYRGPAGAVPFYRKCGYAQVHEGEQNGVPLTYFEKVLSGDF
jgi:GNAT superfamily N-acetyltransferase